MCRPRKSGVEGELSHNNFNLYFSNINKAKHIFIYLRAIFCFLVVNCLFMSFVYFYI